MVSAFMSCFFFSESYFPPFHNLFNSILDIIDDKLGTLGLYGIPSTLLGFVLAGS